MTLAGAMALIQVLPRLGGCPGRTIMQPGVAARVMSLTDPLAKMSKDSADDDTGVIRMLDSPDVIAAKIRRALEANPAGSSGVVAEDARGTLVGHLGVTHVPMLVEGATATFGRICASWVYPLFRTAGVHSAFAELDDAFREAVEGKTVVAAYGTFADRDWWTLRRMREFFPVRTEVVLHRPAAPHRAWATHVEAVAA